LDVAAAFEEVMGVREAFGGLKQPPADEVTIAGADPVFSTRFKIGETCAAALGGVGVAVSDISEIKTGRRQKVAIDVRHAAAGLRSSAYMQRRAADGKFKPIVNENHEAMRAITQPSMRINALLDAGASDERNHPRLCTELTSRSFRHRRTATSP
jgi:hypothetical protein